MTITEIDLSENKGKVAMQIVRACEQYGFFTVVNHGVPDDVIQTLEYESFHFFSRPMSEKMAAGPDHVKPYGYGCNTIGPNGDVGRLEYLTLSTNPSSPQSIIPMSQLIPKRRLEFCNAACEYVDGVRKLTCMLLSLTARGLGFDKASILTDLIRNDNSDSILRLNHYPPSIDNGIGFGEHSDPQIFTLLRSNDVPGLQIYVGNDEWISVPPNPSAFCVFVGDTLHAMTNGRFVSVRHRAITNSSEPRMSIAFFGAPSLEEWIYALPGMVTPNRPLLYNPFTWGQYKANLYSGTLRLADDRFGIFRVGSSST
ncbi:gibberellin 2-beta-dioxygenase 2-like [Corylus avellana]|uniref:gibberellin 2-beta-dioxygenase 2-like n=1 Tax=Corylus avellana TaxID=13451 RepID=UPI001E1F10BB|nr:gibberellin 2-beta-dioxygenase 2-like [Corylus avellana]